ncbi:MAG: O-antigen ligase family protein [Pyrinomonadaceae bacterium]
MFSRFQRRPIQLLAILWPLALLTPHLPGIPRPAVDGLPWRQELTLSLILSATLALLLIRPNLFSLRNQLRKSTWPLLALSIFVFWILLSSLWATDHYQSLHLTMQWACYLIFFALLLCAPARSIRSSIRTLIVVLWILIIASVIETWFGAPVTDGSLRVGMKPILRASGTFGELMGVCSVLFAGFFLCVRRIRTAAIIGATSAGCWLATLQSLERAPFIGTAVGVVVLLVIGVLNSHQRRYGRLTILTIALLAVLAAQHFPSTAGSESTSTIGRLQQNLRTDSNTHARLLLWAVGLEMLREHPVIGVGGNNYQIRYDDARATFASNHPDSSLIGMNDNLLPMYAHNEYVQMLAELGVTGFMLFVAFIAALVLCLLRRVRAGANRLISLSAASALLAFMLSSGASASSFRSIGGGLVFFFAAAVLLKATEPGGVAIRDEPAKRQTRFLRLVTVGTGVTLIFFTIQASGTILLALAEQGGEARAERNYQRALQVYPSSASANFSYGMWLYANGRFGESVPRLQKALDGGLNSSICYEYLAGAEDAAGDGASAEATLSKAVQVYPRSVFLVTRHSVALDRLGRHSEANAEMSRALAVDPRASRGWQQLIVNDIDAAYAAASRESDIALPGELVPQAAVFAVLHENEIRNPELVQKGWRKRVRSVDFNAHATSSPEK